MGGGGCGLLGLVLGGGLRLASLSELALEGGHLAVSLLWILAAQGVGHEPHGHGEDEGGGPAEGVAL